MFSFWVPGIPKPQGSKRAIYNSKLNRAVVIEDNAKTYDWRSDVKVFAAESMGESPMIDGPVLVKLNFVMRRPTSTSAKKPTPPAVKRPDLDKLTRAIFDSITGVLYNDDSQVVELVCSKRIAEIDEQPGCRVQVMPAEKP